MSPKTQGVTLAVIVVFLLVLIVLFCPSFSPSAFIYVEF